VRTWPFTGRQAELDVIDTTFTAADVAGVVIAGATGVGKTRLAQHALTRLAKRGCHTEWVTASAAAASIPFGAVAHLLPADGPPEHDPLAVLRAVAAQVRARGSRKRVAIGVDDAHLLDDGSAAVLTHLAACRLAFLLVTVRTGEPVPDAVVGLWKDGTARRLDLAKLQPDAVDRLMAHVLPGTLDGASRSLLHRACAGNPLALSELLRGGLADGALRRRYGVWRWERASRATGPAADIVAGWLRDLDPTARQVLELVACGEPLPVSVLAELAGDAAVEAAEEAGLLVVDRSHPRRVVRLAHPLYRKVLCDRLPASRARQVWQGLARALLDCPVRHRDDALRAAAWLVKAGDLSRPEVLVAGARRAMDRCDLSVAEWLARAVRDATDSPGRTHADCLLAEILEYRGRSAEAAAVLSAEPPAGAARAQWAVARASILYWGQGRTDAAEEVLDSAVTGPRDDLVEAARAWILVCDARCDEALAAAGRVLGRAAASDRARTWAASAGSAAAGFLGHREQAMAFYERGRALALARREDLPWGLVQVGFGGCLAHLASGSTVDAWALADEGYRAAVEDGASLLAGAWAGIRGIVEVTQGRPESASTSLREAVAALEHNDAFRFARLCLAALAAAAALTGDGASARDWLSRSDRRAGGSSRFFAPWIGRWRGWTEAASGGLTQAVAAARHAAELACTARLPIAEAEALHDIARFGGATDLRRLDHLAAALGTPLAAALATSANGLAAGDGHLLAQATTAFETLGYRLLAAETAGAAARAYRRTGHRASASVHVEKAAELRRQCEGAGFPLAGDADLVALLTGREREVVLLAVDHPSRHIAQRLGLSPRTVDNNLARAYAKLGVSGRTQLRALLHGGITGP
jgi:DNA-binding CsgD family transcriptional regulator